ncbi:restriction endonuclease PLD domain-containing protein [Faucicola boevrei]|uniref:restriction endonuclease PLD domain-containing protein n=1 Tax=Faucicola boevrei TaxID=346665 RepID=UPI0003787932|nr:restriction endonuclease PLD domain-containing protein [Moraxella boevrei]
MFTNNLENIVFNRHVQNHADEFLIITGYIGPQPFARLQDLPINCQVIYGMYGSDSISYRLNKALNQIQQKSENTNLFYSKIGVHAKCYLWRKDGQIIDALVGSANFSRNGLATPNREILVEADNLVYTELNHYFDLILKNSIRCDDNDVQFKNKFIATVEQPIQIDNECRLSFLARDGEVPSKSGLNWGCNSTQIGGTAHTCVGDAEIRITKEHILNFPNLFPPKLGVEKINKDGSKGKLQRQNDEIELIWDDGKIMAGLLEQNIKHNDMLYPKALCSSHSKAELGLYLRKRLGVSDTHTITRADLETYGRTDVTITLQAEGVYYLDFSVN